MPQDFWAPKSAAPAPTPRGFLHFDFTDPQGKKYSMPWHDATTKPSPLEMAQYAYEQEHKSLWQNFTEPMANWFGKGSQYVAEPLFRFGEQPSANPLTAGLRQGSMAGGAMIQSVGQQLDAGLTSPLGIATVGGGELASLGLRSASPLMRTLGRVGQGSEIAGSGALGLHGAERVWNGEDFSDKAGGALEMALGGLGLYSGFSKGVPPTTPPPPTQPLLRGAPGGGPRGSLPPPSFIEGEVIPYPEPMQPRLPESTARPAYPTPRGMATRRGLPPAPGEGPGFEAPGAHIGDVRGLPAAEGLQLTPESPQPVGPFYFGRRGLSTNIEDVTDVALSPRGPGEAAFNALVPERYKPTIPESNLGPVGPFGYQAPAGGPYYQKPVDTPINKQAMARFPKPATTGLSSLPDSEVQLRARLQDTQAIEELKRRAKSGISIPDKQIPDVTAAPVRPQSLLPDWMPQARPRTPVPAPQAIPDVAPLAPEAPSPVQAQGPKFRKEPERRIKKDEQMNIQRPASVLPEFVEGPEVVKLKKQLKKVLDREAKKQGKPPVSTDVLTPDVQPAPELPPLERPLPITTTPARLAEGEKPTAYAKFTDAEVIKFARKNNPVAILEASRRNLMEYLPGFKKTKAVKSDQGFRFGTRVKGEGEVKMGINPFELKKRIQRALGKGKRIEDVDETDLAITEHARFARNQRRESLRFDPEGRVLSAEEAEDALRMQEFKEYERAQKQAQRDRLARRKAKAATRPKGVTEEGLAPTKRPYWADMPIDTVEQRQAKAAEVKRLADERLAPISAEEERLLSETTGKRLLSQLTDSEKRARVQELNKKFGEDVAARNIEAPTEEGLARSRTKPLFNFEKRDAIGKTLRNPDATREDIQQALDYVAELRGTPYTTEALLDDAEQKLKQLLWAEDHPSAPKLRDFQKVPGTETGLGKTIIAEAQKNPLTASMKKREAKAFEEADWLGIDATMYDDIDKLEAAILKRVNQEIARTGRDPLERPDVSPGGALERFIKDEWKPASQREPIPPGEFGPPPSTPTPDKWDVSPRRPISSRTMGRLEASSRTPSELPLPRRRASGEPLPEPTEETGTTRAMYLSGHTPPMLPIDAPAEDVISAMRKYLMHTQNLDNAKFVLEDGKLLLHPSGEWESHGATAHDAGTTLDKALKSGAARIYPGGMELGAEPSRKQIEAALEMSDNSGRMLVEVRVPRNVDSFGYKSQEFNLDKEGAFDRIQTWLGNIFKMVHQTAKTAKLGSQPGSPKGSGSVKMGFDPVEAGQKIYGAAKTGWKAAQEAYYEKAKPAGERVYQQTKSAREAVPKAVREPVAGYGKAVRQSGSTFAKSIPGFLKSVGESGLTQLDKMGKHGAALSQLIQKSRIWEDQLSAKIEKQLKARGMKPDVAAETAQQRAREYTIEHVWGKDFKILRDMVNRIPEEDRDTARYITNKYFGRIPENFKDVGKFTKAASELEAASKLSQFFISNLANVAMTGMKGNVGAMGKALKAMADYKAAVAEAHETGALQPILAELKRDIGAGEVIGRGKKFSPGKLFGIEKAEEIQRTFAAITGKHTAQELFEQIKAGRGDLKTANRRLKELLLEDDLNPILRQKELTKDQLNFAGNRMSELTQGRASSIDLPPSWSGHPLFNLATQFKRYAFTQTKNIKQAFKTDPKRTLAVLAIGMPAVGEALGTTKSALNAVGRSVASGDDLYKSFTELQKRRGEGMERFWDDMGNAWALGLILDSIRAFGRGESGFTDFWAGPFAQDVSRAGSAAWERRPDKLKRQAVEMIPFVGRGLASGMKLNKGGASTID